MCASDLFNAYSSMEKGKYLDKVSKQNAAMSNQAADDALARGAVKADEQRITTQEVIGTQRAGFAANGIDVNSGSAGQVQNDSAALGELDALTIMNNAAREAYGYQVQAIDQRQQGKLAKYAGKMEAIGSILGGTEKAFKLGGPAAGSAGGGA
jgi:type II secretory pathway component PulM